MVMQTAYAEIMNKHLTAGHISGWGWLTHNFGGPIRRVLNWNAPTVVAVLNAEEMISADLANHGMWGTFSQASGGNSPSRKWRRLLKVRSREDGQGGS